MKIINYINKNLNMIILVFFASLVFASWITDNTQSMILGGIFFLYFRINILEINILKQSEEEPKVINATVPENLTMDEYDALLEMRWKKSTGRA